MVVASPIACVVHKLGIGCNIAGMRVAILKGPVGSIEIHQIVEILIMSSSYAQFMNAIGRVVINDVVSDDVVIVNDTSSVATANQNSSETITEYRIAGNGHVAGGVPEVNAFSRFIDDIVPDTRTQIGNVDTGAMVACTTGRRVNVVDYIADNIVVRSSVVDRIDARSSVAVARCHEVVDMIVDCPFVGTV